MNLSSSFAELSNSDLMAIIGALMIMVALVAFIKFATKRKTGKSRKSQSKSISNDKLYKTHLPLNKSSRKKKSRKPRSNSTENVGNELKQPTILTRSLENINKKSEKKKGKSKKKKSSQNDGFNVALSHENDDGGEWHLVATKEQRQARKEKKQNNDDISLTPIISSYQQPTYFMPSTAKDVAPRFARAAGEEWKCKATRRQPSSSPSPSPPPPPSQQQKQKPAQKATSCLLDRDHSTAPILPTYNKWNSASNTDSWSRFASFLQSNNSKLNNSNHQQQEETQAWNPMMSTTDITSWRATSSSNNLFSSSSDHNTNHHHHSTWNYGDGYANGGSDWLSGGAVGSPTRHHHESNWMSLTQAQHHLPAHMHHDATWNSSFPSASVSEQLAAGWSLYAPSIQPTIQREADHHREKVSLSSTPPMQNSDPWNPTIGDGANDVDELANGDWSAPDQDWSNIGRDWTAPTCTKRPTQTYFDNGSNDEESALNKLMTMSMEGNNRRRRRRKKKQPDQQQQPASPALATTAAAAPVQSNDQTECCDEEVIASHEVVVEEFDEVKQCNQPVVVEKGAGEWTTQTKKRRNKKQ